MATKSKSRTSKSNLSKKVHLPIWAVVLGLLVLVGTGAYLVYTSFASSDLGGGGAATSNQAIYCNQGNCVPGTTYSNNGGRYHPVSECRYTNWKGRGYRWTCPN